MTREEAKGTVKAILGSFQTPQGGLQFDPPHNPATEDYIHAIGFRNVKRGAIGDPGWNAFEIDEQTLPWLIEHAVHYPAAYEVVEAIIKRYRQDDLPLPEVLTDYVHRRLDGVMKKPRQHGASLSKHYWRDLYAAMTVKLLKDNGYDVGKSDGGMPDSASDIVSEVFSDLGVPAMTYDNVRKAYYKHKQAV